MTHPGEVGSDHLSPTFEGEVLPWAIEVVARQRSDVRHDPQKIHINYKHSEIHTKLKKREWGDR